MASARRTRARSAPPPGGTAPSVTDARSLLAEGLAEMSVRLAPQAEVRLVRFLEELSRWNRTHNLTRIVDPESMVRLHLLDSLTALPFLGEQPVLDIGTGAGIPGIVLAVADPTRRYVLLDRAAKKVAFCRHAVAALGLDNVQVVHARAEDHQPARPYRTVVARALARLQTLVDWSAHLAAPGATLVALKGKHPAHEVAELGAMGENAVVEPVSIPGLEVERHIVRCTYLGASTNLAERDIGPS